MKACCFTGHRPDKCEFLYDGRSGEFVVLRDELERAILGALDSGVETFYCGGAWGFDLLAAETLLSFREKYKFSLVFVVPFEGQESGFPAEWKRRYATVRSCADEVICLSESYYRGCYYNRNRYMVDHSDMVIAHYDGSAGGTRNTVNYAEKQGKPVINVGERLKNMFNYSFLD